MQKMLRQNLRLHTTLQHRLASQQHRTQEDESCPLPTACRPLQLCLPYKGISCTCTMIQDRVSFKSAFLTAAHLILAPSYGKSQFAMQSWCLNLRRYAFWTFWWLESDNAFMFCCYMMNQQILTAYVLSWVAAVCQTFRCAVVASFISKWHHTS